MIKKLFVCVCGVFLFGLTFAWSISTPTVDAKIASSERVPVSPSPVQYVFNETWVKQLIDQKNTLLQLNCDGEAILRSLWFGTSLKKLFSIWIEEWWYEYNFDIKNCSLRWNKVQANYTYTKSLTESQALAFATTFMQTSYLKDKVFYQLGKPFVLYKNSNGPVYPLVKEATSTRDEVTDIEIDPNDTGNDIVPEYTSFTIMYPYLINGQEVWEQYGSRVWLTLEVTADGVMSLNARLLPFKVAKRNSEKVWSTDAVRILKNWGNSPFYGNPTTVKFTVPQKVLVLFNLWRDNKNYLYLSSWIGLHSALKVDQRAQQPYSMILSDYKIGNNAQ